MRAAAGETPETALCLGLPLPNPMPMHNSWSCAQYVAPGAPRDAVHDVAAAQAAAHQHLLTATASGLAAERCCMFLRQLPEAHTGSCHTQQSDNRQLLHSCNPEQRKTHLSLVLNASAMLVRRTEVKGIVYWISALLRICSQVHPLFTFTVSTALNCSSHNLRHKGSANRWAWLSVPCKQHC